MEANLLGAEPSAVALGQRVCGNGDQQPEGEARDQSGHEADVDSSGSGSVLTDRASMSLLAVGQLVWLALLAYGGYWVAMWLPL